VNTGLSFKVSPDTQTAIAGLPNAIAFAWLCFAKEEITMNKFDLFEEEDAIDEVEIAIDFNTENAISEEENAIESEAEEKTKQQKNAKKRWKPEEDKYSEGFFIRCTKSEKKEIEKESKNFEMSKSRFLIAKALNASRVLTREEIEVLAANLQQLSALGRNVNQIAVGLNVTRLKGETIELSQKQLFNLTLEIQNLVAQSKENLTKLWRS
jgi:hypothetical protein